ncbi:uncharacterized protein K444DRAFT_638510 [Hyaloscypha bicolor E]|uniref:Uncharacterized protein n=1 Tax=Hyaloscypha bicolor E TaxID=1095630 RepID=A0A2J6SGM8_9HELO|nr:uncharacterized protein K444DRAFT_638510 [Hyaloscypha bicolor E]PMD49931.1 hypothetical protein K444DRAFT_638510 [Hyaloscypha bicolor E]
MYYERRPLQEVDKNQSTCPRRLPPTTTLSRNSATNHPRSFSTGTADKENFQPASTQSVKQSLAERIQYPLENYYNLQLESCAKFRGKPCHVLVERTDEDTPQAVVINQAFDWAPGIMAKDPNKANTGTNTNRGTSKHESKLEALGIDISPIPDPARIPTVIRKAARKQPVITNRRQVTDKPASIANQFKLLLSRNPSEKTLQQLAQNILFPPPYVCEHIDGKLHQADLNELPSTFIGFGANSDVPEYTFIRTRSPFIAREFTSLPQFGINSINEDQPEHASNKEDVVEEAQDSKHVAKTSREHKQRKDNTTAKIATTSRPNESDLRGVTDIPSQRQPTRPDYNFGLTICGSIVKVWIIEPKSGTNSVKGQDIDITLYNLQKLYNFSLEHANDIKSLITVMEKLDQLHAQIAVDLASLIEPATSEQNQLNLITSQVTTPVLAKTKAAFVTQLPERQSIIEPPPPRIQFGINNKSSHKLQPVIELTTPIIQSGFVVENNTKSSDLPPVSTRVMNFLRPRQNSGPLTPPPVTSSPDRPPSKGTPVTRVVASRLRNRLRKRG